MQALTRPVSYLNISKDKRRISRLWEDYQSGETKSLSNTSDLLIVNEWRRCSEMGLSPNIQQSHIISKEELEQLIEQKAFILRRAEMVLNRTENVLSNIPGILLFADENGTILHTSGDKTTREKAAEMSNLVEGGCWGESSAGTNGIGTAIAKKAPVHVYASEHFCQGWHRWTCAGSPVMDPFSDRVLGVVNFTTFEKDYRDSALGLSYSLANSIAGELRLQIEMERLQLIQKHSILAARYPSEGIMVFDRLHNLVQATPGLEAHKDLLECHNSIQGQSQEPLQIFKMASHEGDENIGMAMVVPLERRTIYSIPAAGSGQEQVSFYGEFATANAQTKQTMNRIGKLARTDMSILLVGETGTGKELVASYIHTHSLRSDKPFVAVNCGAISRELFESKFFGYEKGAYTGADAKGRRGLFEMAEGGTLFLDEVGELPLEIQVGLLRVLETGEFRRVGSEAKRTTDCRILAATNRPLLEAIEKGTFRSDLYYRLSVVKQELRPLRKRPEDVEVLVQNSLKLFCEKHAMKCKVISPTALDVLRSYDWPGNGREIRNVVEAAAIYADDIIELGDLPSEILKTYSEKVQLEDVSFAPPAKKGQPPYDPGLNVHIAERKLIVAALKRYKKVNLAAKVLGMSRSTLYRRLEDHNIDPKKLD